MSGRGRKPKVPISERPLWAQRIRKARLGAGLTQETLATLLQISQSAVADYETGGAMPPLEVALKIANALNINFHEINVDNEGNLLSEEIKKEPSAKRQVNWTDSPEYDIDFEYFSAKFYEIEVKFNGSTDPVDFAKSCRTFWGLAISMPVDAPLKERLELIISQHRIFVQSWAKSRKDKS